MRSKSLTLIAAAFGILMFAGPVFGHHGSAAYEETKQVTVSGTVTEFRFVNPHVLVYWEAKDAAGNIQKWSGERSGPNSMARNAGWNKNTLKPGDQVTVTGRQSKNGTYTMAISKILLDGKDITGGGGDN
jgi:hypothetical protein